MYKFKGPMTAIITPFKDGRVDEDALRSIIEWQIKNGTSAIVPCGTTGEAATVTLEERDRIVRITVEQSSKRVPVLAGAGSNSTEDAIALAKLVRSAGADGQLQVTPYYNKPMQDGLYQHFKAIALACDLPMMLYNVPGRTAVNMTAETTLRLSAIDSICGIKEACGNLAQVREICQKARKGFSVVSGEDAQNLDIYQAGGMGCISVTGNVAPRLVAQVWTKFESGDIDGARKIQDELAELNKMMFIETNPIPAKTSLALMGRCREEFRLPMTRMSADHRDQLISTLKRYNLQ